MNKNDKSVADRMFDLSVKDKLSREMHYAIKNMAIDFVAKHFKTTYDDILAVIKKTASKGLTSTIFTVGLFSPKEYGLPDLPNDIVAKLDEMHKDSSDFNAEEYLGLMLCEEIRDIRVNLYTRVLIDDGFRISADQEGNILIFWA